MLVLSRKVGETIQIGDQIVVHVARIGKDKVRLGIDAPPHIWIVRPEAKNKEPRHEMEN